MLNNIPQIGAKGRYELLAPFDSKINPNTVYTTIAARRLNDFVEKGQDPKTMFYDDNNIEQYWKRDLENPNLAIITLRSESNKLIYIPSSFIVKYPLTGGVAYSNRIIGISIGAIPDKMDLQPLLSDLRDFVEANIGVVPEVKTVVASNITYVDETTHTNLENVRRSNIEDKTTLVARLNEANILISNQADTINSLMQYIEDNI